MKKYMLVLFVCLFSSTSFSQSRRWFYQPMNCYVSGTIANCVTTNYRFEPIFCEAQVNAITYTGKVISKYFEGWIQVRENGVITVKISEDDNDTIVNIKSTARCLF